MKNETALVRVAAAANAALKPPPRAPWKDATGQHLDILERMLVELARDVARIRADVEALREAADD